MRLFKLALAAAAAFSLSGCAALGALASLGGAPPQAPPQFATIGRAAIDFALNSFDAVLSTIEWGVDAGKIVPGSATAKQLASVGRKVMAGLGVADSAQKLGNEVSYNQAFADAKSGLVEFRALAGLTPSATALTRAPPRPFTQAERLAILRRLETPATV